MLEQESVAKKNKYLREECLKLIYEKTEGNLLNRYPANEAKSEFQEKYPEADFSAIMRELYQKKLAYFVDNTVALLEGGIREIERMEGLSDSKKISINVNHNQINNSRLKVHGSFVQGSNSNKIKVSSESRDDESWVKTAKDIINSKPIILMIIIGIIVLLYAYKSGFPILEFLKIVSQD